MCTPSYPTKNTGDLCIDPFTWVHVHPCGEARLPFDGFVLEKRKDHDDPEWRLLVVQDGDPMLGPNAHIMWVLESHCEPISK